MINKIVLFYNFSRKISSQAAKQVYLQKVKEDKKFKELLNQDKQSSLKHIENENFVPEPKRGDSRIPRVKDDMKETNPHIIFRDNLIKTMKNLQIRDSESFDVVSNEMKNEFFLMKKLSEEQEKFQEQVEQKKRKKELKDTFKSIVDMNIQPDEQYAEQIPYFNKLSNEEKFDRIQDWNERYDVLGKIDPYLLQRARTSKNIEEFIIKNFVDDQRYFDQQKIPGQVEITQILTNRACTVVWINVNFVDVEDKKQKKEYIQKLNKYSQKYSWKMCQDLGLKYGPDIRWVISRKDEKTEEVMSEIDKQAESIIKSELVERYKQGQIPRKISKSRYNEIVDELRNKKEYFANQANETEIPKRKSEAENKNIHSKVSQQDKKSSAEKFWDQL